MVPIQVFSNYIICASARSGSNVLCEILSSLDFVGKPEEHLWDPPDAAPERLIDRWPRVRQVGTGDNGVFGIKLMWYQMQRLECELPDVLDMRGDSLSCVLATALAAPKYVYLTRRDRIRQAISLIRAIQSGQWRSMDSSSSTPRYDTASISREVRSLEEEEATWEAFFTRNGVSPYRLTYEELVSTPQEVLAGLLSFLGHDTPITINFSATRHRRQADNVTEEWLHRYERECASESVNTRNGP